MAYYYSILALASFYALTYAGNEQESVCERMRRTSLSLSCTEQMFVPQCNGTSGFFLPKQCYGDWCYCVDSSGKVIAPYKGLRSSSCSMTCECAIAESNSGGRPMNCDAVGNFRQLPTCLANSVYGVITNLKKCDKNGFFLPAQCLTESVCQCIDKENGAALDGFTISDPVQISSMNCQCARDLSEAIHRLPGTSYLEKLTNKERMTKLYPCTTNGNYKPPCLAKKQIYAETYKNYDCDSAGFFAALQCRVKPNTCFCADKYTGQQLSHYSYDTTQFRLPSSCQCARDEVILERNHRKPGKKCNADGSYTQCFEVFQDWKNANKTKNKPECNCVGQYKARQCIGNTCYCVDKFGNQIEHYQVPKALNVNMTCECARDFYTYLLSEKYSSRKFYCNQMGSYYESMKS